MSPHLTLTFLPPSRYSSRDVSHIPVQRIPLPPSPHIYNNNISPIFPLHFKTPAFNYSVIAMESVASNSPSPPPDRRIRTHLLKPAQPIADRIARALHHPLRLLHRFNPNFFVLGATGNVYTVALSTSPSCTCPDRTAPCKHILFVFIKVLGVPLDDACIRRRTLRPCQLGRLLAAPTSLGALAGARVRERFHQLFRDRVRPLRPPPPTVEAEDGATCPVCLEEMKRRERVVACEKCRNLIHQKCMLMWKRSKRKRSANCVICRARWSNLNMRAVGQDETYLNLSAYLSESDTGGGGGGCGGLLN